MASSIRMPSLFSPNQLFVKKAPFQKKISENMAENTSSNGAGHEDVETRRRRSNPQPTGNIVPGLNENISSEGAGDVGQRQRGNSRPPFRIGGTLPVTDEDLCIDGFIDLHPDNPAEVSDMVDLHPPDSVAPVSGRRKR